jgi:hypothetical protein
MMMQGSEMNEIDILFGKAGEPVPVVDVADIKLMWAHYQELNAQHPGGAFEIGIWKQVCSPGADIRAVSYRCSMLGMLEMMLRAAWIGGELSENAFKVAARIDLQWMAVGVVQNSLPFSLEQFLVEMQGQAA